MKRRCWPLLAAWLLANVHRAGAEDLRREFRWRALLEGSMTSGQVYRVALTDDVYDGAKTFPFDLRVMGAQGDPWPILVREPAPAGAALSVPVDLVSERLETGAERYLERILRLRTAAAQPATHNELILRTPGREFLRRVEVAVGPDGTNWTVHGGGFLVHQSGPPELVNFQVSYPVTEAAFLRARLFPNARDAMEPLSVLALEVLHRPPASSAGERRLSISPTPDADVRPGIQTLVVDTGVRNLPVDRLRLETTAGEFAVPVKVYGRNRSTNDWRWVADGGIYRTAVQTRDSLALSGSSYRYLKLDLMRYESPDLAVTAVWAHVASPEVLIEARGDSAHLYFGSDRHALPMGAASLHLDREASRAVPEAKLGARHFNPHRLALIFSRYLRVLGWALLCALGLFGAYLVVRWLRSRTDTG